jgi:TolB-like protein/Tfp pilus assembly protein PilF
MASLIPSYEYDIFISYRQKDNKYDGWVTEFVDNLKKELEATFKEEISVYFDINPHDGLLETHDVDASLKEKLKCLVFIPIISRTYCDPKSFAWEHEFKAFVEQASQDKFGLKVRLPNGNVANRVLPVRIYDLDNADIKLCESVLGGVLRSVDFIYKSAGVNRPLLPKEENPQDNLNHTNYRDQINKVANSIKEIITAIEQYSPEQEEVSKEVFKPILVPRKNRKTTIIAGAVIALALIILGFIFIPKLFMPSEELEKSIAVLPFINDSPDQENAYFINGIMDEVLNNLQKIKDFRVLSRTSTEQYRGSTRPPIPKIGKALNVNYIVEGSGQKYGNKFVLRVQLIAANNERHLWARSYDREIQQTSDIINIQSEIAQLIAAELEATITPEEKQTIEKIPTANLNAYDFYQRGKEELVNYWLNSNNKEALKGAEKFYYKALEYDTTFAPAYSGLAIVYIYKHSTDVNYYFAEDYLDSSMILANRALLHDDHLAEAYYARGLYYGENGKPEQAIKEFDKATKYNPNYWEVYVDKAVYIYANWDFNNVDYIKAFDNLNKAVNINHGKELPGLLRYLGAGYSLYAGFEKEGNDYYEEAFKLDGDTNSYLSSLAGIDWDFGNREKAIELYRTLYKRDSVNTDALYQLGYGYSILGQYEESLKYYKKYIERLKTLEQLVTGSMHRIGFVYWQIGYRKEAEYYFNEHKKISEESIKKGREYLGGAHYDLAGVYAFMGDKEKAYENLKLWAKIPVYPYWWIVLFREDPLFDRIRNEPEFQQIERDVEAKYQTEHERVRKWLEEQRML